MLMRHYDKIYIINKMHLKTGNIIFTQSAYKFFNALFIIVKYSMIH